ncbi:MAG: alpha-galactosidase [Planctomycetes bacterium]|nr:alpha-galactosidase [Planctomycetota bacterium]
MKRMRSIACLALGALCAVPPATAQAGEKTDDTAARVKDYFGAEAGVPPFSFTYGGRASADLLPAWKSERLAPQADGRRTRYAFAWADPETGLSVRCDLLAFAHHPAIEWVISFENAGAKDTPILEEIHALDVPISSPADPILHYAKGAVCSMDDFRPIDETMAKGAHIHLQPAGGRSSSDFLPFFNLETPPRGGVIAGIGWSGEWAADFEHAGEQGTRVRLGMAGTHLFLRPGERIRTPSIAFLAYRGDRIRGQNLWRRFILDEHRPTPGGRPLELPVFNGNWGGTPAAAHLANIEAIIAHDLPVEYYWIDAEWFGTGPWWMNPGDWRVKKDLYPDGFKPISDLLHRSGRKLLLWFEPERVCEGTPWATEHRDWLLEVPAERRVYNWGDKHTFPEWVVSESRRNQIRDGDRLFNLAIPEARAFLTDFISDRIDEFGLDCYRHDANIAPLEFWRGADPPDRQGMTEIRWVEGLYAFWDGLLRRHPDLIIDNCASGGRRIDLESLSRSTPFWRTDFAGNVTAKQCHTYGISFWVPLNSTGGVTLGRSSDYEWRSAISSTIAFGLFGIGDAAQPGPAPADFPFEKAKATLGQYRALQPYFLGDYYPLTPYSQAADAWIAWQFDRPDLGEGMVQAFRREQSPYEAVRLSLGGLEPDARYTFTDLDEPTAKKEFAGAELMEKGLLVERKEKPAAAIITYERTEARKP